MAKVKLSGIDRHFTVSDGGAGFIEKDPRTGEPTGVLRNCTRFVKSKSSTRPATDDQRRARLRELFRDYNAAGLTTICDRDGSASGLEQYVQLRDAGQLTVRGAASQGISYLGAVPTIQAQMRKVAEDPLFTARDPWQHQCLQPIPRHRHRRDPPRQVVRRPAPEEDPGSMAGR